MNRSSSFFRNKSRLHQCLFLSHNSRVSLVYLLYFSFILRGCGNKKGDQQASLDLIQTVNRNSAGDLLRKEKNPCFTQSQECVFHLMSKRLIHKIYKDEYCILTQHLDADLPNCFVHGLDVFVNLLIIKTIVSFSWIMIKQYLLIKICSTVFGGHAAVWIQL